jgi:hypothetical protein
MKYCTPTSSPDVNLVIRRLIDNIDPSQISRPYQGKTILSTNKDLLSTQTTTSTENLTHDWLWPTVGTFFRPKDVIVTETGQIWLIWTEIQGLRISGFLTVDSLAGLLRLIKSFGEGEVSTKCN